MDRPWRLGALLLVTTAVVAGAIVFLIPRGGPAIPVPSPRAPALPDLVTLPLFDFLVGTDDETGDERLRFSATIGSIGPGPLIIEAHRNDPTTSEWQVIQWFEEPEGARTGHDTEATMAWGGHGHDHWHLAAGEVYALTAVDGSEPLARQTKAGFCFFDQIRLEPEVPGSPASATFGADLCGDQSSTTVSMGMSVGWSDPYYWQLPDQSVEVTGLADGAYRLSAVADPDGWLTETDDTNNGTWVDLQLGTTPDGLRTVEVVDSAE